MGGWGFVCRLGHFLSGNLCGWCFACLVLVCVFVFQYLSFAWGSSCIYAGLMMLLVDLLHGRMGCSQALRW